MISSAKKHFNESIANLKLREENKKKKEAEKEAEKKKKEEEKKKKVEEKEKKPKKTTPKQQPAKNLKPLFAPGEKQKMLNEITIEFYPKYNSYEELLKSEDTERINKVNDEVYIRAKNKSKKPEEIVEEKKKLFDTAHQVFNNFVSKCIVLDNTIDTDIFKGAVYELLDDTDEYEDFYMKHLTADEIVNLPYISIDDYNDLVMKINPKQVDLVEEQIKEYKMAKNKK
jgi:hypothetical protein